MSRFSLLAVAGLVSALLFVDAVSHLQAQTIRKFDAPNTANTMPSAINIAGQVTGAADLNGFLRQPDGRFVIFNASPNSRTTPYSINSAGEIVGSYTLNDVEAFLRDPDGSIVTFPVDNESTQEILPSSGSCALGGGDSEALAVNDWREVTGAYSGPGGGCDGFLRQPDGEMITFLLPSLSHPNEIPIGQPQAINFFGQIAGFYIENNGLKQIGGFIRQPNGNIDRFFVPNSTNTVPTGINVCGQIAGYYTTTNFTTRGFLRQPDGTFITFNIKGSKDTEANAINDVGEITGSYVGQDGVTRGFIRQSNGILTTFDVAGAQGTFAQSINLFGQIVGYFFDGTHYHGFIRTPYWVF